MTRVLRWGAIGADDRVVTRVVWAAPPETLWQTLMFFEDLPPGPRSMLHYLLPRPLCTEGDKTKAGGVVRCTYERGGYLVKHITAVEPGRLLRFEVTEQHLGIERWFRAHEGSYELTGGPRGTELALTTRYAGTLRPRFFFRPIEQFVGHQFHHYILAGMREVFQRGTVVRGPARTGASADAPGRSHTTARLDSPARGFDATDV